MRRAMGAAARQRVATGFTWDDYGDKMLQQYRRILRLKGKVCE